MDDYKLMQKKEEVLISVIVPVYNGEKYIKNCIEMLLSQNEDGYEIILINDGSIDKTHSIIEEYKDNEILVYFEQVNSGVSAARNKGIELSRGKWIIFCDVDDEIKPGYIKSIKQEIKSTPDADIFIYATSNIDDYWKKEITKKQFLIALYGGNGFLEQSNYLLFSVWSKVINKQILLDGNISFDVKMRYGEDVDFIVSYILNTRKIVLINKGFYRYAQYEESVCHSYAKIDEKDGFLGYCKKMDQLILVDNNGKDLDEDTVSSYRKHILSFAQTTCSRSMRNPSIGIRQKKHIALDIGNYAIKVLRIAKGIDFKLRMNIILMTYFPYIYILTRKRQ